MDGELLQRICLVPSVLPIAAPQHYAARRKGIGKTAYPVFFDCAKDACIAYGYNPIAAYGSYQSVRDCTLLGEHSVKKSMT